MTDDRAVTRARRPVTAQLVGGLGNQLFITAAAMSLAARLESPLELDTTQLMPGKGKRTLALDGFPQLERRLRELQPSSESAQRWPIPLGQFTETGFGYDERFALLRRPVRLRGYFQSPRYFESIQHEFLGLLNTPESTALLSAIEVQVGSRWIAVHVRRGDYMQSAVAAYHGLLTTDYFIAGLAATQSLLHQALPIVIFTDDAAALPASLQSASNMVVESSNQRSAACDLVAMSHAAGIVSSNSSYSWWAAYLRDSLSRPVICPRPWIAKGDIAGSDLLLPHWLTLRG